MCSVWACLRFLDFYYFLLKKVRRVRIAGFLCTVRTMSMVAGCYKSSSSIRYGGLNEGDVADNHCRFYVFCDSLLLWWCWLSAPAKNNRHFSVECAGSYHILQRNVATDRNAERKDTVSVLEKDSVGSFKVGTRGDCMRRRDRTVGDVDNTWSTALVVLLCQFCLSSCSALILWFSIFKVSVHLNRTTRSDWALKTI